MGTKTIGLDDEAYERLAAEKQGNESFSDTVKRLTEAVAADWRHGFGSYADRDLDALREVVADQRKATSKGLAARQQEAIEAFATDTTERDEAEE
jgi:predicted CopG family antitoxin